MDINALMAQLSPVAQQILQQADPQTVQMLLEVANNPAMGGVPAVEQALQEFAQSLQQGQGGNQAQTQQVPGMPPTGAPQQPPAGASASVPGLAQPLDPNAVPQAPGGNAGLPPEAQVPPNAPPQQAPNKSAQFQLGPKPRKWTPKKPEKTAFAEKKPTFRQIQTDARKGREWWQSRDDRIALDVDMYHLAYDLDIDEDIDMIDNQLIHRSTHPNTLIERIAGLTAATHDAVTIHVPHRHDSQEYKDAAQKFQNAIIAWRMVDEDDWDERGSYLGDVQPPLPRKEAGLMALEGGFGWTWHIDPGDESAPFEYEVIPWSQLYPIGHATTRQYILPLWRARAISEKIDKAYPLNKSDNDNNDYDENMEIRIICWGDSNGYWYAEIWEELGGELQVGNLRETDSDERWIQKPQRVDYGIPYYDFQIWNGTYSTPNTWNKSQYSRYIGYGALTMLRKTFRLLDIMISAIATGALRFTDPPLFRTVQEGRDMLKVPDVLLTPGSQNKGRVGEDIKPIHFDVAATQSGTAFVQAIGQELANAVPPVVAGLSQFSSGVDRNSAADAAKSMVISPIMDAMERAYERQHRQRGILAYRYSKNPDNKDREYFSEYPISVYTAAQGSFYGVLKTKDLELSGVRSQVRYQRYNLQEEQALANVVTTLINGKLMDHEAALIRLGYNNPTETFRKILQDAALLDPEVLKGMVEAAIMAGDNPALQEVWIRNYYAKILGQSQGSPPAPTGQPSPAAMPGQTGPPQGESAMNPTQLAPNAGGNTQGY